MNSFKNKIEATHLSLLDVLHEKKYTVGYYQREYNWEEKHIEQLITDLTSTFLNEYSKGDKREQGKRYNNYFLGPFVIISESDVKRSIIDGQQRLSSLTLFLIWLNNLQKTTGHTEKIESMIFSELRGIKSFNIAIGKRQACLEALFNGEEYKSTESDDKSTTNMNERYNDIEKFFPDELKNEAFPFFIDWLKYNVIMVEITAYSEENAYTIFETMNDRGLHLNSSEMLKGFILSRFNNNDKREEANMQWKKAMMELQLFQKDEDQRFFQSWLRAKYAITIRQGRVGSKNEDFEKIGTRFHSWFRENLAKVELVYEDGETFEYFLENKFSFFFRVYVKILEAEQKLVKDLEHVYYIHRLGIAPTLSFPLMLAPLTTTDNDETIIAKINTVARYIETFAVRRSINNRNFSASSIRFTMYSLVKEIRNKNLNELKQILSEKLSDDKIEKLEGMDNFLMNGRNSVFVKFLLARLTAWVECQAGEASTFTKYHQPGNKNSYEIEHIWAYKPAEHRDEFPQEQDFKEYRNRIGGLILLPRGTNQSYNDLAYKDKQPHYIKENLLASSLCAATYERNPNFTKKLCKELKLPFTKHETFNKKDLNARQELYRAICEQIWPQDL